jgi:hypothetical protein
MERRGFLKTLFGGAALAVLPPILVERLAATPVPAPPPPISPGPPSGKGTVLCLYRDMKGGLGQILVASSIDFSINLHTPAIPIPKVRYSKKYGGYIEDFNAPVEYVDGPRSWDAIVNRIQWFEDPRTIWDVKLHMVSIQEGYTLKGDVYIGQYEISIPMDKEVYGDAELVGTGELTMTTEKG